MVFVKLLNFSLVVNSLKAKFWVKTPSQLVYMHPSVEIFSGSSVCVACGLQGSLSKHRVPRLGNAVARGGDRLAGPQ